MSLTQEMGEVCYALQRIRVAILARQHQRNIGSLDTCPISCGLKVVHGKSILNSCNVLLQRVLVMFDVPAGQIVPIPTHLDAMGQYNGIALPGAPLMP